MRRQMYRLAVLCTLTSPAAVLAGQGSDLSPAPLPLEPRELDRISAGTSESVTVLPLEDFVAVMRTIGMKRSSTASDGGQRPPRFANYRPQFYIR